MALFFAFTMPESTPPSLLSYLQAMLTPERVATFERVLAQRTRHLTVVVEDIYQPHNASAVLRSCDCFGVQDVHIVEYETEYNVNPGVALGSSKWITMHQYKPQEMEDPLVSCMETLKTKGYRVLATTPHTDDQLIGEIDLSQPTALVFGNEGRGISDRVHEMADGFVKIPMYGFTESFNISVSAALCLYELTERLRKTDLNWQLSEAEKEVLRLAWTRKSIKNVEKIEARYALEHPGGH